MYDIRYTRMTLHYNMPFPLKQPIDITLQKPMCANLLCVTGAIGLIVLSVQGVTSIPSVAEHMTWSEIQFVLSRLGWLAYLVATSHVTLMEWQELIKFDFECYVIIQPSMVV